MRSDLVAINPLLRVDPLLQITRLNAASLRATPGIVGFLWLTDHVVDDAEIDERLRRIATECLELVDFVFAERHRRAVDAEPALLLCRRRFLGDSDRFLRVRPRARSPMVVRDALPTRRHQLACATTELAFELGQLLACLLARCACRAAVVRVGAEELRADLCIRA